MAIMSSASDAPTWLLRPLPANASIDARNEKKLEKLIAKMPVHLGELEGFLNTIRSFADYEPLANEASVAVWRAIEGFYSHIDPDVRQSLVRFAHSHMVPEAMAKICRRLAKDISSKVRRAVVKLIKEGLVHEVALPNGKGAWDATGWLRGTTERKLFKHKTGKKILEEQGLPVLSNLKQLRELLGIKSEKQLGFFLLATEVKNGPYVTFKIPKKNAEARTICAPKTQLKWVQRRIHEKILAVVPPHDAAHGFVAERSTVTNAEKHLGSELIVKFDLKDFFPTIHYFRVLGLFANLGYPVGDGRFASKDTSDEVAPVLARLCCYTADPKAWGSAIMPQGAPTSPAISNLVCRRMDARLAGLMKRMKGTYTRYADDLTFSFKKTEGVAIGKLRWWVDQICQQEGFSVNQAKFRVIRSSQRQVVTGLVVNETLHVPREERRRFRAILHNCEKHGVKSQEKGNKKFRSYLRGYASYLNMVHPEEGAELLERVAKLLAAESEGK
jgi:RNA-directed DNA polymerase